MICLDFGPRAEARGQLPRVHVLPEAVSRTEGTWESERWRPQLREGRMPLRASAQTFTFQNGRRHLHRALHEKKANLTQPHGPPGIGPRGSVMPQHLPGGLHLWFWGPGAAPPPTMVEGNKGSL